MCVRKRKRGIAWESGRQMGEDIHSCDRGVRTSDMQESMLRKEAFHIRDLMNCEGDHEQPFPKHSKIARVLTRAVVIDPAIAFALFVFTTTGTMLCND